MKKKFTLDIVSPCSENFDNMIPNAKGSFCSSCAKNVIDLSRKTNSEVAKFIVENKDKNICARITNSQLRQEFEYNEISKINNFKYAAVAASVLLASNLSAQEKTPVETEIIAQKPDTHIVGKVAYNQTFEEEVFITIKGKLLDAKEKKPFDSKKYQNLVMTINGSHSIVNPETGEFSIFLKVLKSSKSLIVTVTGKDHYLSKSIHFSVEQMQNNIVLQNIIINEDELSKVNVMTLGGLGVNYVQDKKKVI